MWLVGVVVRRYIDFLILLIPTPLVYICSFLAAASLLFVHFFNVFRSCNATLSSTVLAFFNLRLN